MYSNLPAKLKWNAQLIKTIYVSNPLGKYVTHTLTWGFFHLPFPTEPLLVDFNMICMEVCE